MSKYVTTEKIEKETEKILNTSKGVTESTDAEKAIFKHIEYEIIEPTPITIFDKERLVDVKLSNKNMGEVLVKYFTDSVTFSFTNAFSDNKLQNEALDAKYQELFVNAIDSESVKLTESTINLKLVKQEDKTWKIEFLNEDQFINAILPSFKETLTNYLTENDLTSGLSTIFIFFIILSIVSGLTLTPKNDNIKDVEVELINIEILNINCIKASVITLLFLTKGNSSVKVFIAQDSFLHSNSYAFTCNQVSILCIGVSCINLV